MKIEVAYAEPMEQVILALDISPNTTAIEAIIQSGILHRFPGLNPDTLNIGIFSKPCKPDQTVKEGDRIEIYRPLIADPKQARRNRASKLPSR